jgi:uncharacterized membrane protein YgdD (TMEM256/DUF423 family)
MPRSLLLAAAVLGFSGVALGAFGAHALRQRLSPELLAVYQTGVQYHLVHAVAALTVALMVAQRPLTAFLAAGWLFVAGVVVFSGSLYVLAITGVRVLGAITPLGGLAFLAGWLALAVGALQQR